MNCTCKISGCKSFTTIIKPFYYFDGESIRRQLEVRECNQCSQHYTLHELRFGVNFQPITKTWKTWGKI